MGRNEVVLRRRQPLAASVAGHVRDELRVAFQEVADLHIAARDEITWGWRARPEFKVRQVVIGGQIMRTMRLEIKAFGSRKALLAWALVNEGRPGGVLIEAHHVRMEHNSEGRLVMKGLMPMRPWGRYSYDSSFAPLSVPPRRRFSGWRQGHYDRPTTYKRFVRQGEVEPREFNHQINRALESEGLRILREAYVRAMRRVGGRQR